MGQKLKKNAQYIFYLYIFISWKKKGESALNIFSIFYTHHRIPNEHMMTINFDTITNNYEVIYVIKTVMKYYLEKIDTSFHQRLPLCSTFICWRHTWRELVYEYSWAKSPMISGYDVYSSRMVKNYRICPLRIEIIHGRHRVVQTYTWAGPLYS
jgi:hypothetical protein